MCPWLYQGRESRYNASILGNASGTQGASTTKTVIAALCPWFDENARRQQEFMVEMRLLSRLRHPCITTVMGAVMTRGTEPMMVMEYMDNGSLYDLLRNETLFTGGEIIIQIVRDVAQGLRFLHASKPPILHGDLKAKNILIDSRFRAKVADFGLSTKKNGLSGTPFWMAPEYLRGKTEYNTCCDVYSFGIIMYEIYGRATPYEGEHPRQVLRKVCDPRINKRPPVPPTCPAKMVEIMTKCWSPDPFFRPQAKDLDLLFMDMNPQDAEPLVEEMGRVRKEKATGDMLYQVFPKKVADKLKAGEKVEPETHENVTIFFSDIVHFTDISRIMSAGKVCQMLDRLYVAFDDLASKHKIFKVETIGDAWMGVTNLENDQDDTHVKQIAEFAVDAVAAAAQIMIDEDDPKKGFVRIRVGFHSGQVVSNVIGSLNPRYGLFGDTVNTASRMESNSYSQKIQCSEASAELLKVQAPDMPLTRRGKIAVKGKGNMTTYWVGEGLLKTEIDGSCSKTYDDHPTVTFADAPKKIESKASTGEDSTKTK
jgi:class 3 adenylate cyclase